MATPSPRRCLHPVEERRLGALAGRMMPFDRSRVLRRLVDEGDDGRPCRRSAARPLRRQVETPPRWPASRRSTPANSVRSIILAMVSAGRWNVGLVSRLRGKRREVGGRKTDGFDARASRHDLATNWFSSERTVISPGFTANQPAACAHPRWQHRRSSPSQVAAAADVDLEIRWRQRSPGLRPWQDVMNGSVLRRSTTP